MAITHLTSAERVRIYEAIFQINQQFHLIVTRLIELRGVRHTFASKKLAELRILTQEMQAEINCYLCEKLHDVELADWGTFGKVRIQRGKRKK